MADFSKLIVLLFVVWSVKSHAAFTSLTPPVGYSAGAAAAFNTLRGGSILSTGIGVESSITVAGSVVRVPAILPLAADAGAFAAALIFRNPLLFAVAGVAAWLYDKCVSYSNGVWNFVCARPGDVISDGQRYKVGSDPNFSHSPSEACQSYVGFNNALNSTYIFLTAVASSSVLCTIQKYLRTGGNPNAPVTSTIGINSSASNCPAGYFYYGNTCQQNANPVPIGETDFINQVKDKPVPVSLPFDAPASWPVKSPIINGGQPLQIATGLPVPNPGSAPQTYTQPVVNIIPSPTVEDPWRVDIVPATVTGTNPVGITVPTTVPPTGTGTPTTNPDPCLLRPDTAGCVKLGNLEPLDIRHDVLTPTISSNQGFGPSTANCPAPHSINIQGKNFNIGFQPICFFADLIRPIVLGVAFISAAFSFFSLGKRN